MSRAHFPIGQRVRPKEIDIRAPFTDPFPDPETRIAARLCVAFARRSDSWHTFDQEAFDRFVGQHFRLVSLVSGSWLYPLPGDPYHYGFSDHFIVQLERNYRVTVTQGNEIIDHEPELISMLLLDQELNRPLGLNPPALADDLRG